MAHSDKVIDHYDHPRDVGSLPKDGPNGGTGLVGPPECGDVIKLGRKKGPQGSQANPSENEIGDNSLEITQVASKCFLGVPYASVSARSRHIQESLVLFRAK